MRFALTLVFATAVGLLVQIPRAHATLAWRDGLITETFTLNCLSQMSEYGIGTFVGQLYDTTYAEPYVGERFYMRIHVAGLGHPCADNYVDVQFVPPAGVTASSVDNYPLRCFYQAPGNTQFNEFGAAQGCPQPPFGIAANSAGTGFRIDRRQPDGNPTWFLPAAERTNSGFPSCRIGRWMDCRGIASLMRRSRPSTACTTIGPTPGRACT